MLALYMPGVYVWVPVVPLPAQLLAGSSMEKSAERGPKSRDPAFILKLKRSFWLLLWIG